MIMTEDMVFAVKNDRDDGYRAGRWNGRYGTVYFNCVFDDEDEVRTLCIDSSYNSFNQVELLV